MNAEDLQLGPQARIAAWMRHHETSTEDRLKIHSFGPRNARVPVRRAESGAFYAECGRCGRSVVAPAAGLCGTAVEGRCAPTY